MWARRVVGFPIKVVAIGLGLAGMSLGLGACSDKDGQPTPTVVVHKTALPPYPAWSDPMIGQILSHFVAGRGTCAGAFDAITDRYTGRRAGMIAGGWGWDVGSKSPLQHVLFVNADDIVVGAANGGFARPDVPQARQDVTSANVGWKGVIGITGGKILAVGVTSRNASCSVGSFDLNSAAP